MTPYEHMPTSVGTLFTKAKKVLHLVVPRIAVNMVYHFFLVQKTAKKRLRKIS
jgi:hypothetical protein